MQIPLGNFGNEVTNPGRVRAIPEGSTGIAISVAGARAGQQAMNTVADAQEEQRRAQAAAEREAAQELDTQERAQAITQMNLARDGLADLHDEINTGVTDGTVPKDEAEAEFNKRSRDLLDKASENIPMSKRPSVSAQLDGDALRLGNGVRKAVAQRGRQDVTSNISQTLEHLAREYKHDPVGATERAAFTITDWGPGSTLTPQQQQKALQDWKEGTQYTAGYELVSAGRDDPRALAAAEKAIRDGLPDLDPQKRATLLDRASMYRASQEQRAIQAGERAQREEERRLNKAEAEFNVVQALADKGGALSPEFIDQAMQATAGTPYQAGIVALAKQAATTGGLAAQPIAQQRQALDQLNKEIATKGRSPELDKRKEAVEKVVRASETDAKADPLRAYLERGPQGSEKFEPLDMRGGVLGMIEQMKARVPLAEKAAQWSGSPASPLTADEAATLQSQLSALPAKERSGLVATMAQALGPQVSQGLAQQLDKKDKALGLAFAFAGAQTPTGRNVSELVLKGEQARKDGTSTKGEKSPETKPSAWSARISAELEGVFPAQTLTEQARDAAVLIAHGLAAEAGGQLRDEDLTRAVGLAIGGEVLEHNGRKIPLAAGVTEEMLQTRLESVQPTEFASQAPDGMVRAGGMPMPVADFVKTLPGQQLMYVGPGRYTVIVGGRPVLNTQGKPVIIKVQ